MENVIHHQTSTQKVLSIAIPAFLGWGITILALFVFRDYSFGLFFWLPFVLGATSTMIGAFRNKTERKTLRNNAYLALLVYCLGLLLFAWEGIVCLIMAAPVGLIFTYFGFAIGFLIVRRKENNLTQISIILLFLSVPALLAFEKYNPGDNHLYSVTTRIEIKAPKQKVWNYIISFPQLKEPTEFIFKTGIAYPVNATISGRGAGAVRHCNFTTGTFVEPITVWDEPNHLQFSVQTQPETMKEFSFYPIHPGHLHGYWSSTQGRFLLTTLPNGNTLVTGTTWYENKIRPGFYWSLWSNYIVHKIHLRVLNHIKELAEKQH